MRRRISIRRPIEAESVEAVFAGDPGTWLPFPARPRGPDRWTVGLAAGPATRWVACTVGGVWRTDRGIWRGVRWEPEAEIDDLAPVRHGLPTFRGELGIRVRDGQLELALRGSYHPPGGWLGALFDAAALRNVAAATGRRFLEEIAEQLGAVAATTAADQPDG